MADTISHELIESSFEAAHRLVGNLPPDTIEARRAREHVKIAEDYAHRAVENVEAEYERKRA